MRTAPALIVLALSAVAAPDATGADDVRTVIFLAEDRPIFVRLRITLGDRPFDAAWPDSVQALRDCLDRDGDGTLSAKEADPNAIAGLIRLATGEAPTVPPGAPAIDLAEVLRPTLGPFRVRLGRLVNGRTDALFDHLDRDKDGRLTHSELAAIAGSLRRLDLDDDEMIGPDELEPFTNPAANRLADGPSGRRSRFTALPPVIELLAGESTLRLARLLLKKYDRGQSDTRTRPDGRLSTDEFAIDPDAFTAADTNGDGSLDSADLRRYLAASPVDLALDIAYATDAKGRATVRIGGDSALPKGVKVGQLPDGDIEFAVDRVRLDIHVDDGEQEAENARRILDRRFQAADANNDGYLEGKERTGLDAAGSPLAGLTGIIDRDGDGKLYARELTDFLDRQLKAARGRLVLTTSDQGRAIFGILDLDRDRRLSAREIMRTVDRVTSWDGDHDGQVTPDEIPYHFQVTIARGALSGLAVAGSPMVAAHRAGPAEGPDWFRLMDRNHDGDVSHREFLGPRDQFNRLDRDQDGLIDSAEAGAAKAPEKDNGP